MRARVVPVGALALLVTLLAALVTPAHATFPGTNGRIAFTSDRSGSREIWSMNPDGSNKLNLTEGTHDSFPAWAPHGREIAFSRWDGIDNALFVMDAWGGGQHRVTQNFEASMPAWSPDAENLAFAPPGPYGIYVIDANGEETPRKISQQGSVNGVILSPDWAPGGEAVLFTRSEAGGSRYGCWQYSWLIMVDPAGTTETTLAPEGAWLDSTPSFSPDGETVVYARRPNPCPDKPSGLPDLYTVPIASGTPTQLTNTPDVGETEPVWSPDGTKIAFAATVAGNTDIYVMNADGTGRERLTTDPGVDTEPSWGSVVGPVPGFPRPKTAKKITVPLVPAFRECTAPNRMHGPPLASGSCSPPERRLGWDGEPGHATVGSPDANGHPAQSTGYVRLSAIPGDPSTETDDADVRMKLRLTDVRDAANPSAGYPWKLAFQLPLRLTDKRSIATTLMDVIVDYEAPLQVEAPCAPAGTGVGSTCSVTTTYDTVAPGLVREGARSVWQFTGPVQVYDSGTDGYAPTTDDNAVVATQGVFVP